MRKNRFRRTSPSDSQDPTSRFDSGSEQMARGLAKRFSRRSFLGQTGAGGVAVAMGGLAGAHIDPTVAAAHTPPCGSGFAVPCNTLNGNNNCPAGTCSCGWWIDPDNLNRCPGSNVRWHDCCGACNEGNLCNCVSGHPHCCNHQLYDNECLSGTSAHIKCRFYTCDAG